MERRYELLGGAALVLGLLGAALALGIDPAGETGRGLPGKLGVVLMTLAGLCLIGILLSVDPAWPISLGVAAMIFSGNWEHVGSPLPLDRVLIATGIVSLIGRAQTVRDVLGRAPSGVHLVLALAAIYGIGSALMVGTFDNPDARFALLDRFGIVPFVLFAIAPAVFGSERSRLILLGTLTAVGAYLVYVSLLGRLGPKSLVFPGYITDPLVGIHADRARGPFVEASANGLALFACAVAAAMVWSMRLHRRIDVLCGLIIAGSILGIVFALTRAVWLGSALALFVALLSARETRRYVAPALATAALLVVGALAVVPGLSEDADERQNDDRPVWDRKNSNNAALRMIEDRPLLGFGWFKFIEESGDYMRLGDDYPITRAYIEEHNVFLSNAVELGLLGTLIWAAGLLAAIGGAIFRRGPPELRLWRIGLIAVAVQWLVVANFVPLGYAFSNALLWLWAGVAWGPSMEQAASRFLRERAQPRLARFA